MKNYSYIFFCVIFLILSSCRYSEPRYITLEELKGTWKLAVEEYKVPLKTTVLFRTRTYMSLFSIDSVFNDLVGFYTLKYKENCETEALGTETKFHLRKDTLEVWNIEKENWRSYRIEKLVNDTLYLRRIIAVSEVEKFVRANPTENQLDFDEIAIVQKYRTCSDHIRIFNKNGLFRHFILDKVNPPQAYSYQLSQKAVDSLVQNFSYVDITTLRDEYNPSAMGEMPIYTIFFLKEGRVIKQIEDSGFCSPPEFKAGFLPIVGFDLRKQHEVAGSGQLPDFLTSFVVQ